MLKHILAIVAMTCVAHANEAAMAQVNQHDIERMEKAQHQLDENVKEFQKNLEGLKTTVDFAPMAV